MLLTNVEQHQSTEDNIISRMIQTEQTWRFYCSSGRDNFRWFWTSRTASSRC